MKILRDESGFVIWGERFVSYQEVQCFRYLQWLGLTPEDMRHEYQVGRCSFDFFPLGKVFWEHHPISMRSGEDLYQYGKKRRLVLNASGYSKIPLVVSDSMFRDQWEVCDLMNDYEVDFKRGRVQGDPTICYVHDFSKEYEPVLSETWKVPLSNDFPLPDLLLGSS